MKEGKDYLFGDSKAAIVLSRILYEQFPTDFRQVTRVMSAINELVNNLSEVEDEKTRAWLYKALRQHINEAFPSVSNEKARTHAQNVLMGNLRDRFKRGKQSRNQRDKRQSTEGSKLE